MSSHKQAICKNCGKLFVSRTKRKDEWTQFCSPQCYLSFPHKLKSTSWTEQEDKLLSKVYARGERKLICQFLPRRTWHAIRARAGKLGLARKAYYRYYSDTPELPPIALTDWAYIAGLFDGEGSVGFNMINLSHNPAPQPFALITNTDKQVLEFTKITLNLGKVTPHRKTPNRKDVYVWSVHSLPSVLAFLKGILLYLKIKRRQAMFTIRFCELRIQQYMESDYRSPLLTGEMKDLVKKAVSPTSKLATHFH